MAKSKLWVWVAIIGLVLLNLSLWDRACRADARLAKAEAEYAEARRIAEADHELGQRRIEELTKAIGHRDEKIGELDGVIAADVARIRVLEGELRDIQDAEPPTTPEIEAMPIVINLRAQVKKLAEGFNLARETITLQSREIDELKGKCLDLEAISAEWKAAYDREHALRLAAEDLFTLSQRRVGLSKTVAKVALGVAGAGIIYGLLK